MRFLLFFHSLPILLPVYLKLLAAETPDGYGNEKEAIFIIKI